MAYNRTTWVDNSTPAINATNLNNIETGLVDVDTRLTSAESDIISIEGNIASNAGDIATNIADITALETQLTGALIVRTGTFSGTWSPTLDGTFNISTYNDYNWSVNVHQRTVSPSSSGTIILDSYLDVDNKTLRFTSSNNGSAVNARYTLIGVKKTMSNYAQLNQ